MCLTSNIKTLIQNNKNVEDSLCDFLEWKGEKLIYGNSVQADIVAGIMRLLDVDIKGRVYFTKEASLTEHLDNLENLPFYTIKDIVDMKDAYVIVAQPREEYEMHRQYLKGVGIVNVIGCCWSNNSELKKIVYEYACLNGGVYSL